MLYFGPTIFGIEYNLINAPFYTTSDLNELDDLVTNRTTHYTFLFNTFIMMNLFNQLNCRKLGLKEYNIFRGFFNNFLFLIILAGEFVAQFFMISIGGKIFRTTMIPFEMYMTSIAFGVGSLVVAALLKTTKEEWVDKIKFELDEEGANEGTDIISKVHQKVMGSLKRSETERLLD